MGKPIITLLLFLFLPVTFLFSQSGNPFSYIERAAIRLDSIKNYECHFVVKTDFEAIDMPVKRGRLVFKWPAHYLIINNGFTLLPEMKLVPIIRVIKKPDFNAAYLPDDQVDMFDCKVIRLIPVDSVSLFKNLVIWVDKNSALVRRVQFNYKNGNEYFYHYRYHGSKTALPSNLEYRFKVQGEQKVLRSPNPLMKAPQYLQNTPVKGKLRFNCRYTDVRIK